MSLKTLKVSKNYAINEFKTVGLVLILYCFLVLYIPLLIDELKTIEELKVFGVDVCKLIKFSCLIIGTVFPFMLLRIASKKKFNDFVNFAGVGLKEHLINYVVFFSTVSAAIFCTMMIGQYVNVSGQLVSSIGITFNEEYMTDVFYIICFVVVTPIIEEYAFRGCLLNCLSRYGKYFATIATSIIYALAHGSFVEMIPAFIMSIVLSKMSLRYKSITPTIVLHIMFNLSLYGLFLIPESSSIYMIVFLAIIFVLAAVFLINKSYHFITIKKSNSNKQITLVFLSTFTVTFAMFLFVLHTILLTII